MNFMVNNRPVKVKRQNIDLDSTTDTRMQPRYSVPDTKNLCGHAAWES